jgi:hypothetical protein
MIIIKKIIHKKIFDNNKKSIWKYYHYYFSSNIEQKNILTSESAPLSAPGHLNVTYSWHRLCTTNEQTGMFFFFC